MLSVIQLACFNVHLIFGGVNMENKRLTIMLAVLLALEVIQVIEKIVELVMR